MGYQGSSFKRVMMLGGARLSSAETFLRRWSSDGQGLAIDFSDQSIAITDTSTPANEFRSVGTVRDGALVGPGAKITYTSPSPKLCRKSDGTYGYRAQNLYLNSEAPANRSVTVVSGLPYIIAVTGTVSITLSGAATGTVTAGNPITFTASSGTLTCGSTSGAGTVHLRSTIAAPDYIKTTSAPLYDLPYDWTGTYYYPLVEPAATNLFLNSRTAATQNVSVTAQAYTLSFFGTGTITLSGASTAGPLVGTGANDRVSLTFTPSAGTLTLTVSGTMDFVQIETGTVATSPIITAGATVTRAADVPSIATSAFPFNATAGTLYVVFTHPYSLAGNVQRAVELNNGAVSNRAYIGASSTSNAYALVTASSAAQAEWTVAGVSAVRKAALALEANNFGFAVNGVLQTTDTSGSMPTGITILRLGSSDGSTSNTFLNSHIHKLMYVPRRVSDAELQVLTA